MQIRPGTNWTNMSSEKIYESKKIAKPKKCKSDQTNMILEKQMQKPRFKIKMQEKCELHFCDCILFAFFCMVFLHSFFFLYFWFGACFFVIFSRLQFSRRIPQGANTNIILYNINIYIYYIIYIYMSMVSQSRRLCLLPPPLHLQHNQGHMELGSTACPQECWHHSGRAWILWQTPGQRLQGPSGGAGWLKIQDMLQYVARMQQKWSFTDDDYLYNLMYLYLY